MKLQFNESSGIKINKHNKTSTPVPYLWSFGNVTGSTKVDRHYYRGREANKRTWASCDGGQVRVMPQPFGNARRGGGRKERTLKARETDVRKKLWRHKV